MLDETGEFSNNQCNKASVDLEHVFDPDDQKVLKTLIYRHFDATRSPRARWVLENWTAMLPKFVKVYPHEFKRVMTKRAAQKAETLMPAIPAAETRTAVHG